MIDNLITSTTFILETIIERADGSQERARYTTDSQEEAIRFVRDSKVPTQVNTTTPFCPILPKTESNEF